MSTATLSPGTGSMVAAARQRQYIYMIAIVLIFSAMWPYNVWLQRRKQEKDLGEATIGQVDTGGFMLKLAMIGGFRGMVANYLWTQARTYEKLHEWDKLKGTVDFITKLQPHFLSIWTYQGWNLAYNVSVEWDAPEDKYVWIKKGINFLKDGVAKNEKSPDLIWDTAWTYYHKLGFADESIVLRRLFYDDPDDDGTRFRIDPIDGTTQTDNFKLGGSWFSRAIAKVDKEGGMRQDSSFSQEVEYVDRPTQHKGRPGDLHFRTMPAHAQSRYAAALEKQSVRDLAPTFGEVARTEWQRGVGKWQEFGDYEWPVFRYEKEGRMVRIDDWTNPQKIAELKKAGKAKEPELYWTERWSVQTHYNYWKDRAIAESEPEAVGAHKEFYEGRKALIAADFPAAAAHYEAGLKLWEQVCNETRHPVYYHDDETRKDTKRAVRRYLLALRQSGEKEPENYPFKELMKGAQEDIPPDPFDQLEMPRSSNSRPVTPVAR
jgi:hypothetical protein